MEEKQIKDKKEYFRCSFSEIINELSSCVLFYEDKEIDKDPEIQHLSRMKFDDFGYFDKNEEYVVKFLSDDEFNKLFECDNNDETDNTDSDSSDSDEDEQILLNSDEENQNKNQSGGSLNSSYKWKYLFCLKNLLEIKYDLL